MAADRGGPGDVKVYAQMLVTVVAAVVPIVGAVDVVRTVGFLGIIGVWAWRGFYAVFSRRRARLDGLAADRAATTSTESEDRP
jgi:hypothetical protein